MFCAGQGGKAWNDNDGDCYDDDVNIILTFQSYIQECF